MFELKNSWKSSTYLWISYLFVFCAEVVAAEHSPKFSILFVDTMDTYICTMAWTTKKPKWKIFYLNDIRKENNNSAGRQGECLKKHIS